MVFLVGASSLFAAVEFYPVALEDQTYENPVLKTWAKPESFVSQRHIESATQPEPQTWLFGKTDGLSVVT